jgi:hypothetical protein
MITPLLLSIAWAALTLPLCASTFSNFTFDSQPLDTSELLDVGPNGPYYGTPGNVLPGWEVEYLGKPVEFVGYSVPGHRGTAPGVAVHEYSSLEPISAAGGRNGLYLRVNEDQMTDPGFVDLVLRQRGEIPTDAAGLAIFHTGYGQLRINGQKLGEFDTGQFYPMFDVSAFAGREVTLEIAFYRGQSPMFDILGFKPIPEPSTWALFGVGAAAIFYFARRKN